MNIKELHDKKRYLHEKKQILLDEKIKDFGDNFHKSIGAKNEIRIKNQLLALNYAKDNLLQNKGINEYLVKDIHELLMTDIIPGGIYRNNEVAISNTDYIPPSPQMAYQEIKYFYYVIEEKEKQQQNAINMAAFSFIKFIDIHPFVDGNGRTARLLMNYQLLKRGFFPIIINKEKKDEYINRIEACRLEKDILPFEEFIYELEDERIDDEMVKIKI
jgi:Fic family protein